MNCLCTDFNVAVQILLSRQGKHMTQQGFFLGGGYTFASAALFVIGSHIYILFYIFRDLFCESGVILTASAKRATLFSNFFSFASFT